METIRHNEEDGDIKRDPDAGRKFNSMKNRDLADVLNAFYEGKYQQTPENEAKFEALVKVIIGRLKTLDGAKPKVAAPCKKKVFTPSKNFKKPSIEERW